jgi:hypothetical protein
MRRPGLLVGLTLFALAGSVRAQEESPATESAALGTAAPAAVPVSKMQVGIAFLPMLKGSTGTGPSGDDDWAAMKPAYGVGLTFGYNIIAGLSVGVAPQVLFRVQEEKDYPDPSKEYDLMARFAYAYAVLPHLSVYAEFLPGYSIIKLPSSRTFGGENHTPKGLVLGFGAGAAYDINELIFVNLGIGYQMGFQKFAFEGGDQDFKTKFLRIALGGGVKF